MVELSVRIKTEPVDNMDENNNKNGNNITTNNSNFVSSHHLQNHNSNTSNTDESNVSNFNYKENLTNKCCNNINCSNRQKENCPHQVYEKKQAAVKRLLKAVQSNDFEHLKRLLESKPDLNVLVNGQTVLHYCLLLGRDVNWTKQLVNSGANPNLSNLDGWHPIHLAAFNGLQETLSYLITVKQQYHY